jgi:hypothetical protein
MTLPDPLLEASRGGPRDLRPLREPDRDFEYMILDMLETHGAREGTALAAYERVVETSPDGDAISYLARLILDDEQRHHRLFAEMANELRSFVSEIDVEPRVPAMRTRRDPGLLRETRRLLDFEKEDYDELRRLRKALRHSPASSLHPVLVELMLHDTAKHIAILEFMRSHLEAR